MSGRIRAIAYRFGEGRLAHWITLILADRVDVVEGLWEDLRRGHIPNLLRERGLTTEFTHTRGWRRARNIAVVGVLGYAAARAGRTLRERRRSAA